MSKPSSPVAAVSHAQLLLGPRDLPELHQLLLEALARLEEARARLSPEDFAAHWRTVEAELRFAAVNCREVAFPSPGPRPGGGDEVRYLATFTLVAHHLREVCFSVELLFARLAGTYSHQWLLSNAPATLGPPPWGTLLEEARLAVTKEGAAPLGRPGEGEDPELSAAFLTSLLREAADVIGLLASRPRFLEAREASASTLRRNLLDFTHRCIAYANAYAGAPLRPARLLQRAAPSLRALLASLEAWDTASTPEGAADSTLTGLAREALALLGHGEPAGGWDCFLAPAPPPAS